MVCVSNIEETMDNKNLILNATPQNIAIKVGTRRLKKNISELQRLTLKNKSVFPLQHSSIAPPIIIIAYPSLHMSSL
jgi:hypothetical protein